MLESRSGLGLEFDLELERLKKDKEYQKQLKHDKKQLERLKTSYKVINNESGKLHLFKTFDEAQRFQEYLVFTLGVDAEVIE